jgi:CpeT protein
MRKSVTILFLFSLLSCLFSIMGQPGDQADMDLDLLKSWMTGSFSSQEQAKSDSNFYDIKLEMVQIWRNLPEGGWLYVEQAVASSRDKPYRRRVYHLKQQDENNFGSTVFTIFNHIRFAGDWKKDHPLEGLTPDSLKVREGCSIHLEIEGDSFVGSTSGKKCVSKLRGASYATSEVIISQNQLVSWDRGFDEDHRQVWGATTGGYIFKKIKDYR